MKHVIVSEKVKGNSIADVQAALTKMIGHARMRCNGEFGGSSTVHVEESSGWNIREIQLVEERLSDGSNVYAARLVF